MNAGYEIRDMAPDDWDQVRAIYSEGLSTGLAAFSLTPPRWENWDKGHLAFGRLVAKTSAGQILGWAALSPAPDT